MLKNTTRASMIKFFKDVINSSDEFIGINHKIKCAENICKLEGYETETKEKIKAQDFKIPQKIEDVCPITGDIVDLTPRY